ncbi:MAG: methyltransferase protein [Chitinophagaceae bacterium]|nr:methyltransferase protein [Chitinophagaceae bacterium]
MEKTVFKFSAEGVINYDTYLGPFLFEPYAENMASRIDPSKANRVLEVAAGTGRVTRHLRNRLRADAELIATDISPDMLELAKQKHGEANIIFQVADAQSLPFADNSFDYVVCQYGMMFLPDKQKGFNEAFRVLKPGGQFLLNTWDRTASMPLLKIVFDDTIIPFFKGEDLTRFLVPFSMNDKAQLSLLQNAGFTNTKVENVMLDGSAPSAMHLVNGFVLKHSLGKEVADKDPAALQPMAEQMEKKIIEQFGTGIVAGKLSAFVGSGIK